MNRRLKKFKQTLSMLMLIFAMTGMAEQTSKDLYPFDSPALQTRFEQITAELRCLVCQNESLADSTAPLAKDLRQEVYSKIQHGDSDSDIKHYLVARYGQFILFKPAFNSLTYLLWGLPIFILVAGFLMAILLSIPKKQNYTVELSSEEKQRINKLLEQKYK